VICHCSGGVGLQFVDGYKKVPIWHSLLVLWFFNILDELCGGSIFERLIG